MGLIAQELFRSSRHLPLAQKTSGALEEKNAFPIQWAEERNRHSQSQPQNAGSTNARMTTSGPVEQVA